MDRKGRIFIDNQWLIRESMNSINPYTEEVMGVIGIAVDSDVLMSVECAKKAQVNLGKLNQYTRATILREIAERLEVGKEEMARTITFETAKTIMNSRLEVKSAIESFRWFATQIEIMNDEIVPSRDNHFQLVRKVPVGVVSVITPWNFPLNLIARKIAPALAAGNAVIIKPSSNSGCVANKFIEIIKPESIENLPSGTINILHGSAKVITKLLMESEVVRKISFTGSTKVGKKLLEQSSTTMKRLSLELGGNSPFVVSEHANLDKAAHSLVTEKTRNSGQVCVSPNRVLVSSVVQEEFLQMLIKECESKIYGNPMNEETDYSSLIDSDSKAKIIELVEDAIVKGAKLEYQQNINTSSSNAYPLTVISQVDSTMRIYNEEIFGPVLSIISYENFDSMLDIANDSEYGLSSYLFSEDKKEIRKFSSNIVAGLVGINHTKVSTTETPFSGVKSSGMGYENGKYGLQEYQIVKLISIEK